MIGSHKDYLDFLEADRLSSYKNNSIKDLLFDDIWKFQRLMRKLEYLTNCRKNIFIRLLTKYRYLKLGRKLGFTIPINVFGPGLSIAHAGTIVVNSDAKVGANCRLHVCVNIGTAAGNPGEAPKIGDNCYIGPGAKIYGNITIGKNVAIGANAVVNKSFKEGNVTIGGVPAIVISQKGSKGLLNHGYSKPFFN